MDSVHMSWGWLVALTLLVGCAGAFAVAFDEGAEAVRISTVSAESESSLIEVVVDHQACGLPLPEVALAEDDAVVSVRATYEDSGDCDDAIVGTAVTVELARPLGRRVIEVRTRAGDGLHCTIDGEVGDRCFPG